MSAKHNKLHFAQLFVFFWAPDEYEEPRSFKRAYKKAVEKSMENYGPYNMSIPQHAQEVEEILERITSDELEIVLPQGNPPSEYERYNQNLIILLPKYIKDHIKKDEEIIYVNGKRYKLAEEE